MRVLITGGAGFVGHSLAKNFRQNNHDVVCFDNLMRRGSELNIIPMQELGIHFIHGDIRCPEDLQNIPGEFDLFIEASAEPSVHAGTQGSAVGLINTNLFGAMNCWEFAIKRCDFSIFLSSSRVYSIDSLRALPLSEEETRLKIGAVSEGIMDGGIDESFSTQGFRSFYGATKLCAENLLQEYARQYNHKCVINRCGVLCGEGQWGKTDQGVFTLWVARHHFKKSLKYTGFGGKGKQVRDLMHPRDLFNLIQKQYDLREKLRGDIYNVGGGLEISTSLLEYSQLCEKITKNKLDIPSDLSTAAVDIPYYVGSNLKAMKDFSWKPQIGTEEIVQKIHSWIIKEEKILKSFFGK